MSKEKFSSGKWVVYIGHVSLNCGFVSVCCGDKTVYGREMYKSTEIESIANAYLIAAAPEMYESLESTNKELEWAINEINRLYSANHNYHSLDEPERLDMQTCHDNAVLLAKARGETNE